MNENGGVRDIQQGESITAGAKGCLTNAYGVANVLWKDHIDDGEMKTW